ncbi:HlyD family efflux transporter periplasmic adaptor subunit [Fimbriiglobus ruber]|uniref:Uncharacterized protein n=1 Tax=Fimbriiglobus ruber TaxID=1908690 RepID=A0A225D7K8_9BACT|nr:HlyD family efflux transporter periplasmic adaptor subunit [Fimbriiglobus ruber]OWK35624.1 hypothetical protein FRUB_08187 [Fimbriiglobus ruber]
MISLVANAVLAAAVAHTLYSRQTGPTTTGPTQGGTGAAHGDEINALGRVQPSGGVIGVFGPPGDRVVELTVGLGAVVTKGQTLATLSGDPERQLSAAAIDAQIREADSLRAALAKSRDAKLADLTAEVAQERAKADGELALVDGKYTAAAAQESQAVAEMNRLKRIKADGVPISDMELGRAELLVTQARTEMEGARVQKAKAADQRAAADAAADAKRKAIAAEAERALAQVPDESLKTSKRIAEQKIADAAVRAPVAGRVVKVLSRGGDTLSTTPVVQIADTSHMSVTAEVYETDVPRLRDWLAKSGGKPVAVEIDTRVGEGATRPTVRGTVTAEQVAPMIAKNTVFALGPREDADRRVVEVEVKLDDPSSKAVADFIGLQVRARFLPPK